MKDDDPVPEPKTVAPHQLGWLRRPELDKNGIEVWELPDGTLYAADPKKPLRLNVLNRRR